MRPRKPARKPAPAKAAPNGKAPTRPKKAMKLRSSALTLALAVPLAWAAASTAPNAFAAPKQYERPKQYVGTVTRVVDGDTFYLNSVGTRIRLWGLDAPERSEKGGNAATRALREIAHGQRVTCKEIDIDRYDRIVGQCFLNDGGDVTALMIETGKAQEFVRYSGGYYSSR